jgi:hypothetical protein
VIGDGIFNDQINRAADLLSRVKLLEKQEYSPNRHVEGAIFRGKSYRECYNLTIQNYAYDFILSDQSLIHFAKSGTDLYDGGLSFNYLDCPMEVQSYESFAANWLEISKEEDDYDAKLEEWGGTLRQEYEQYLHTCEMRPVTPIRYDYAANAYMPGRHPASHVHFGFNNHIRVATKRVLKPLSFVLLVIRQRYPVEWMEVLAMDTDRILCREIKNSLDCVHDDFWDEADQHEMMLE